MFARSCKHPITGCVQLVLASDMTRSALPVSAVVNTYCRQYDGLDSSDEVMQIVRQLESELRYNCRSDSMEQTSRMLTALRALGNAGLAAGHSTQTLDRCASNTDIPTSVRVAAINAFRRVPCTDSIVRILTYFLFYSLFFTAAKIIV